MSGLTAEQAEKLSDWRAMALQRMPYFVAMPGEYAWPQHDGGR